jgi:RimJ/RimL family protein N-acetyltransferase
METNPKELEPKPDVSFRPMTRDDFPLFAKWLEAPQVKKWWKEPSTPEAIEKKYGRRIDGKSATRCFVTVVENIPIGMVQAYWVKDYKDYAEAINLDNSVAIDWFIGEGEYIGKGLGPQIATSFVQSVIGEQYGDAKFVVASPSIHDPRSISALEKAGFESKQVMQVPGEEDPEQLMVLPR